MGTHRRRKLSALVAIRSLVITSAVIALIIATGPPPCFAQSYATRVPIDSQGRRVRDKLIRYYPVGVDGKPIEAQEFVVGISLEGLSVRLKKGESHEISLWIEGEECTEILKYDGTTITRRVRRKSGKIAAFPVNNVWYAQGKGSLQWARPGKNSNYICVYQSDLDPSAGGEWYEKVYVLDQAGRRKGSPRYFRVELGADGSTRRGGEEKEPVAPAYR